MKRFVVIALVAGSAYASGLADLPARAIKKSQITAPDSRAFHLVATVANSKDPSDPIHTARIEELWLAPQKWRRMVTAPGFSQLLIVNGAQVYEEMTGDYHPNWLRTLANAIFDPGAPLKGVDLTQSDDIPVINTKKICRRFATEVGIDPVKNDVFSSYCFLNDLLDSALAPGYHAAYGDYAKFNGQQVARTVREHLDREHQLEARITELSALTNPDESMFAVPKASAPLRTIVIPEKDARALALDAPPMVWPELHDGARRGVASIYVCIDRGGSVRETYALNNDHPDIAQAAREQLMKWKFRPATADGVPVQAETILTFAYDVTATTTAAPSLSSTSDVPSAARSSRSARDGAPRAPRSR